MRLWIRNGREWSSQFTCIAGALAAPDVDELVIDGEAFAHCPDGLADFSWTTERQRARARDFSPTVKWE